MSDLKLPATTSALVRRFLTLKNNRRNQYLRSRNASIARRALTGKQRQLVLAKTNSRCHICGGKVKDRWQADHVLAHSHRGKHKIDNYLPAHFICNNYRWDYSSEEFQWILKIGVWAKGRMQKGNGIGLDMRNKFFQHEVRREKRRSRPTGC
jgi:hypothetical protein